MLSVIYIYVTMKILQRLIVGVETVKTYMVYLIEVYAGMGAKLILSIAIKKKK